MPIIIERERERENSHAYTNAAIANPRTRAREGLPLARRARLRRFERIEGLFRKLFGRFMVFLENDMDMAALVTSISTCCVFGSLTGESLSECQKNKTATRWRERFSGKLVHRRNAQSARHCECALFDLYWYDLFQDIYIYIYIYKSIYIYIYIYLRGFAFGAKDTYLSVFEFPSFFHKPSCWETMGGREPRGPLQVRLASRKVLQSCSEHWRRVSEESSSSLGLAFASFNRVPVFRRGLVTYGEQRVSEELRVRVALDSLSLIWKTLSSSHISRNSSKNSLC